MAQNTPNDSGNPPRQTGRITYGGKSNYVTEEYINNPLVRQIFEKYGVNLYNPQMPGEQWTIQPKQVNYWQDSRRIGRYYNALRSMPEGVPQPSWLDTDRITAAYNQLGGELGYDWQNWPLLDQSHPVYQFMGEQSPPPLEMIPQWEQRDLQAVSDALQKEKAQTQSGPVGEWTNYGIDYDTWQTLPEWKKWANKLFRTQEGQMGQQALNLAIAGGSLGSVAGPGGIAVGAAVGGTIGAGLGYLGYKEGERQQQMGAAYKPSTAYYLLVGLDWLYVNAQQAMALRQQLQNALVDPENYGTVGDILKDIPAAYEAGEGYYSLLPYEVQSAFSKDGKVRIVNIAGEDTFIDAAPKGEFGSGLALVDIRRKLSSGELSPSQVREYTIQKYGFAAEMSELVAGYALDPLDLIGPVTSGIIGNVADAKGNVALAKSFLSTTGEKELLGGYRQYRQILRQMPVDEVRQMGRITQWFAGLDKQGVDVNLRKQNTGIVDKMFGLTKESRANGVLHDFNDGLSTMLDMENGNVDGMYRLVNSFAGKPGEAIDAVEGGKIKLTVGGKVTDTDMPRWMQSTEAQIVPMALKDQLPKVKDHYDLWNNTRPQADVIKRFADALGETPYELIANLHGTGRSPTDFDTVMRRINALAAEGNKPASDFLANWKSKDMTNAAMKKIADLFVGKDSVAYDGKLWGIQLMHLLDQGAEDFMVNWYGIKPPGWAMRFAGVIKQVQGHLLLGNNPLYLANNVINNVVTMAWEGVLGGLSKRARSDFLRRYGYPSKLRQGIGAAEIGDLETGTIPGTEMGGKENKLGQRLRSATKAKDGMQATSDLFHKADKFQYAAILSQTVERWSSEVAMVKGLREYMDRNWHPEKITGDLRLMLDAVEPGLSERIERAAARGLNKAEIEAEIFTRLDVPALKDVLTPDEINLLDAFPGMMDDIDKGLRSLADSGEITNEGIRSVFGGVIENTAKKLREDRARKIIALVHAGALEVQTGGLQEAFKKLDTIVPERHDFLQQHMQNMDELASQAEAAPTPLDRENIWREGLDGADQYWKDFTDNEGVWWLSIFEGLGAERIGAEYGLVLRNLSDIHDVWNNFYQTRRTVMDEYRDFGNTTDFSGMSKEEGQALRSAKWHEISEKLNDEYIESVMIEDAYQVELDALLVKRYGQQMGTASGLLAKQWRESQLKTRRTMVQAQAAWRTGRVPERMLKEWGALLPKETLEKILLLNNAEPIYRMNMGERDKANKKFYREIYQPLIGSMMDTATMTTTKPKKGKPSEGTGKAETTVEPKPAEEAPKAEAKKEVEPSSVWKLIAEKKPEFAGVDELGRPNPDAKLETIKWLRKWSQEAKSRNVKRWSEVTPALILEAWRAEEYFKAHQPAIDTAPVVDETPAVEAAPVEEGTPVTEEPTVQVEDVVSPEDADLIDSLAAEAKLTENLSPEAAAEFEAAQRAEAAREHVIARGQEMRANANETLMLAPPKEVNADIFREYLHEVMADRYPDKPEHGMVRAEAIWTVIDRISETLAREAGMTKDEWYSQFVLQRGGTAISGNALWRTSAVDTALVESARARGTTTDILKAGFIDVDGNLLDLSGGGNVKRELHSLYASSLMKDYTGERWLAAQEFMRRTGAIRIADFNQVGGLTISVEISTAPGRAQLAAIEDATYRYVSGGQTSIIVEHNGKSRTYEGSNPSEAIERWSSANKTLFRKDPAAYIDSIKQIDYQRGDDWIYYEMESKYGPVSETVEFAEARTIFGDAVAERMITGDKIGTLQGADLQELNPGGYIARGATGATFWLENGKAVIHAFQRAGVADMLHEYIHAVTPLLPEKDLRIIEAWYAQEYGRQLPEGWSAKGDPDTDAFEKLARGFERYMTEGPTGFVGEIVKVFESIKAWMLDIYKSLKHRDIDIRLNDDIRGMFDRWLGAEPKAAETAPVTPPTPQPDMWKRGGEGGNPLYRTPTDSEGNPLNEPPTVGSPLGTADELNGLPIDDITFEGWNTQLRPLLEQAKQRVLNQPRNKIDLKGSLSDEGMVSLRSYLGRVYTQLADTKMAANKYAASRRDAALLDYSKKTGIENIAFSAIPYGFWYTHTAINWALRALNKPSILANYYRLMRMQQRHESDEGYPQRLKGKVAMPMPWLPDWMGDTVYVDPMRQLFPILQMTRPFERAADEKNQLARRTDQLIYDMVDNGEITDEQAQEAIETKAGAIYIKAKAQAETEQERDFQNPFDYAFTLSSPLLPLNWAYKAATGRADEIGQLPFTRLVQNATAMAGIGGARGVNLEGWMRKGLGLPEVDQLEDYRVSRELSNMVAEGLIDTNTASTAMIDRTGEAFIEAQRRVSQQGVIKYIGGSLALDIFPEGEMRQRGLTDEFAAAYDAKAKGDKDAVKDFFDKYPEYSARLMTFKEPEEQLRAHLRSIIWDKYLTLPKPQAKEFREAAGDVFLEAFLDSETRSYDSISTDTLAMWANALGETPEKAGTAELPVDWMDDETAKQIEKYYDEKDKLFGEYDPEAEPDPNYSLWQNQYLAQHPNLIKYVVGETNSLYGLPEEIQVYVYKYRAERDARYPNIFDLQDQYFQLSSTQRKAFLKSHPDLPEYWDWRKQMAAAFPKASPYILSEESLAAEILDDDYVSYSSSNSGGYVGGNSGTPTYSDGRPATGYHPPYLTSSELKRFGSPLVMQLMARFYRNEKLMPGAYREITAIWEQLGKPFGNLEDFIEYAVKPTITQ